MGVLSRRLQRFAVGFSFATFAFFLIGLFAATKHSEGQVVFFLAGLVSVCLFATIFLWLAHGFAWAMIPEEPAEAKKPAESLKSAEAMRPAEAMKAAEPKRPAEAMKAVEEKKPAEAMKEAMKEAMRPAEAKRPAEVTKPAEAKRPAEWMKAAEEKKPAEAMKAAKEKVNAPKDPPDAKYTITGRRIS
jgi:outer membrane biosynthesis protein TonB